MARIRTIKPNFFRHTRLYRAERESGLPLRVAFAGLWTAADREGRFEWEPDVLKLDCLPFDPVDFSAVLEALRVNGHIIKYEHQDRWYGYIPSWHEHQVVNLREAKSMIPAPTPEGELPIDALQRTCTHVHARGEGKGREGKEDSSEPAQADSEPEGAEMASPTPPILEFVTVGAKSRWGVYEAHIDEWRRAFPSLNILGELYRAKAWLDANPTRRKTAKGMPRFIVAWLGRANDRGASAQAPKIDLMRSPAAIARMDYLLGRGRA